MRDEKKDILLAFAAIVLFTGSGIFLFIYFLTNVDEDLSDLDKSEAVYTNFENEIKSINLPPETTVDTFERLGKHRSSILVKARYRTEIERREFFDRFNQELINKGWIFYYTEDERAFKTYKYCRGKFDATLYFEKGKKIWSDGADYWQLNFSLGLRTLPLFENPLPDNCLN